MKRRGAVTLLLMIMTFACSRSTPAPTTTTGTTATSPVAATHGGPGISVMPQVIFPDGTTIYIEIAADDPTREQGLMYRDVLAEDKGMLFIFPTTGVYTFWMKNTIIPLDMIWIDEKKNVNFVASDVPPCKADPCPSFGSTTIPSRYVLETAAGVAKKHGVAPGSVVKFVGLDNVIVR